MASPSRALEIYKEYGIKTLLNQSLGFTLTVIKEWVEISQLRLNNNISNMEHISLYLDPNIISRDIALKIIRGKYESSEAILLTLFLPEHTDVIDLGGGIGYISCHISHLTGSKSSIISVEASESSANLIEKNKELNSCNFEVVNAAYNPDSEYTEISVLDNIYSNSIFRDSDVTERIQSITLNEIVSQYNIGNFSLVCDIEGAEYRLIREELELLSSSCEMLFIEWHDKLGENRKISSTEARNQLEDVGFKLVNNYQHVEVYENQKLCG